jgi:hypothetical protein
MLKRGVPNMVKMDEIRKMSKSDRPMVYEIRIKSHIDCDWSNWFEGLTITQEDETTTLLTGSITDQAALYGLLKRINDLCLPLISIQQVKPDKDNFRQKDEESESS